MNKICTSIEQSKKLMGLGIDVNTADMYWSMDEIPYMPFPVNDIVTDWDYAQENGMLPAWSLSALLAQMPCVKIDTSNDGHCRVFWNEMYSDWHINAVDACVELLERVRKEEEQ